MGQADDVAEGLSGPGEKSSSAIRAAAAASSTRAALDEDKGTVLAVEPKKLLKTTHWSPMGGSEDKPENYHTVTYELAERGGATILTLKQDNNASQEDADTMAEKNWGPVLEGLKAVAEQ